MASTTTTTTASPPDDLDTLEIVLIAVGAVVIAVIAAVILFCICRRLCRGNGRKPNRIGIESDIISAPNGSPFTKPRAIESFRKSETEHEHEPDLSTAPISRPNNIPLDVESVSSKSRDTKYSKIRLADFCSRMEQMHRDNDFMFRTEFERISDGSTTLPAATSNSTAMSEDNMKKNRFVDILPYEDTLVKLDGESDYINASFIKGYNRPREYIVTQGPISEDEERQGKRTATMKEFWTMVWQYNCTSIVMLTQCVENFRHKCGQYWPGTVNGTAEYGDISIQLTEEIDRPICVVRKFTVIKNEESRTVTQWHFKEWEDAKATDSKNLLQFIDMVRMSPASKSESPTIVHCSAGVGRSGAYIALDCLLQHIRDHDDVDILSCVRDLRSQRVRMVQTLEQYIILYGCLAIAIKKKLAEVDRDSKEDGFRSGQRAIASDHQRDHVVNVELNGDSPDAVAVEYENVSYHKEFRNSVQSNETLNI